LLGRWFKFFNNKIEINKIKNIKMKVVKKMFVVLLLIASVSCGSNSAPKIDETPQVQTYAEVDPNDISNVEMFKSTDCGTCHKNNENYSGPSFAAIAIKYPKATDKTIDQLAETIIKGSTGKWGTSIMTPHPTLSKEDAEKMVKFILQVKK
jgi:cytochrome c